MSAKTEQGTPSWAALNDKLRTCDEKFANALLKKAKTEKWPAQHLQRIYGRYQLLRRSRELKELLTTA
jgi:hypothetical protein